MQSYYQKMLSFAAPYSVCISKHRLDICIIFIVTFTACGAKSQTTYEEIMDKKEMLWKDLLLSKNRQRANERKSNSIVRKSGFGR